MSAKQVIAQALGPAFEAAAKSILAHLHDEGYVLAHVRDAVCATHEGIPDTEEERAQWEDGGDPCQMVIRLDEDGCLMSRGS